MTGTLTSTTADGVSLHADDYGAGSPGPAVICLPGLTRNARDFTHLARELEAASRRVVVLESRGRGRSGRADPSTYTLAQELDDLTAAMDDWGIERAQFVGTSRGGLLTMVLAATQPTRVERAVLNDIGPVIDASGLARIATGVGTAMEHTSFEALADALEDGLGDQFPRLCDADWDRFARQLASEDEACVRLDYDEGLAATFREATATPATPDFWPAFSALEGKPVLVIRGAHSDLLSAATVEGMRRRHCSIDALVVPGEGHAPLLWDRASVDRIRAFLA